jgi:molybdate transport system substrate-binding protein
MISARSITYPDPAGGGASGIDMTNLLEHLGIADEVKGKLKLSPSAKVLYESVASGEVEIGFNQISEVLAQTNIEFAGPLPAAIQHYTQFTPGIVKNSSQPDAALALISFLASPPAQSVFTSKGFE